MLDPTEEILDLMGTYFGASIFQRNCSAQAELRRAEPLASVVFTFQDRNRLVQESGEAHHSRGFRGG